MIRYLLILLISVISISYSQNNSSVYKNSSLIQLYSLDKELSDSLLKFNINPMSCRNSILESPIVSTSANFHGGPELKSFAEVENALSGIVDFILEGPLDANAKPSRIVDILTNEIIRG